MLRTATPDDRPQIIELINQVAKEKRWLQTARYEPSDSWEALLSTGYDPDRGLWLQLLVEDEIIVGFVRIFPDVSHTHSRPTGNIGIVLASPYRSRGYGKLLLAHAITIAPTMGFDYLRAAILMHNIPSLRLFLKFDFQIKEIRTVLWPARKIFCEEATVEKYLKSTSSKLSGGHIYGGGHPLFPDNQHIY